MARRRYSGTRAKRAIRFRRNGYRSIITRVCSQAVDTELRDALERHNRLSPKEMPLVPKFNLRRYALSP